jgi:hypothetical protein
VSAKTTKKGVSKRVSKPARYCVCVVTDTEEFHLGCRDIVNLCLATKVARGVRRLLRYREDELEFVSAPEWAWDVRRFMEQEGIDLSACDVVVIPARRGWHAPLVSFAVGN